jgi:hypothetical protein
MVGPPFDWPKDREILVADKIDKTARPQGDAKSDSGCLVKMGWTFGGPAILLWLVIRIALAPAWTLTAKDVTFWVVVGIVIALRYLDVRRFRGRTMDGDPATMHHVVRYAMGLVGGAALLWTLAQSVKL